MVGKKVDMKIKLIRNWYGKAVGDKTRQFYSAGEEIDIPDPVAQQMIETESAAGPEFIPYFAGTEETKVWVKAREERHAKIKAAQVKVALRFAKD